MIVKKSIVFTIFLTIALIGASAFAVLNVVEQSTKTKGATTITWDSSFADFDYSTGTLINMTVNWTIDTGAAGYYGFALKHYTPKSKKDPADGTVPTVTYPGSNGTNSVDVSFAFTDLHLDKKRNVEVGNAHLKLFLMVDMDGDGIPESVVGYGVNVHVEDPQ